jgi:hypothetical protein
VKTPLALESGQRLDEVAHRIGGVEARAELVAAPRGGLAAHERVEVAVVRQRDVRRAAETLEDRAELAARLVEQHAALDHSVRPPVRLVQAQLVERDRGGLDVRPRRRPARYALDVVDVVVRAGAIVTDGTGTAEDERERVRIGLGLADELREQLVHQRT